MDAVQLMRELRSYGLSHAAIGRELAVTKQTAINWDKGRTAPSPEDLTRLASLVERTRRARAGSIDEEAELRRALHAAIESLNVENLRRFYIPIRKAVAVQMAHEFRSDVEAALGTTAPAEGQAGPVRSGQEMAKMVAASRAAGPHTPSEAAQQNSKPPGSKEVA